MRLGFDSDQVILQRTAREFTAKELEPRLSELPESPFSRATVLELLRMVEPFGVIAARVPQETGEPQMDHVSLGILYEEFPQDLSMNLITNDIVALRIAEGASDTVKDRYLPGLMVGDLIAGSGISEPNAGSDLRSIATRAELIGDKYVLNGMKVWSGNSGIADIILVAANMEPAQGDRPKLAQILVDRKESRFESYELEMLGLKRHHLGELVFENCEVPKENLIGTPGDGGKSLARSWLSQRALIGLIAVHIAQQAYDLSLEHARARRQFGKPIGGHQLIQAALVEMATLIEASRLLCYKALYVLDEGREPLVESSMAKYYATESAVRVTNMAIQLHGTYGLSSEYPLERLMRDARMLTMPDGTTEIQKLIAGRELLGISAFR